MGNRNNLISLVGLSVLLVGLATSAAIGADDEDRTDSKWVYTLGVGVMATPNYTGDNSNQLILAPSVRATDGAHWTIGFLEGVQYTINPNQKWAWGLALAPALGRDTGSSNPLRIAGDGTNDLKGLTETDTAVAATVFTKYKVDSWSVDAKVQQIFTRKTQSLFSLGISRSGRVRAMGSPLIISAGLRLRAGDQAAINTLVGVNEDQAVTSGLAVYRPNSGVIGVGLNGSLILPLSQKLSVLSTLSVERLGNELADSSLVTTRGSEVQASVGVFINYKM